MMTFVNHCTCRPAWNAARNSAAAPAKSSSTTPTRGWSCQKKKRSRNSNNSSPSRPRPRGRSPGSRGEASGNRTARRRRPGTWAARRLKELQQVPSLRCQWTKWMLWQSGNLEFTICNWKVHHGQAAKIQFFTYFFSSASLVWSPDCATMRVSYGARCSSHPGKDF